MSIITTFTRNWFTRSGKPFRFLNEYDAFLPYGDCENLGLYVHIPFCRSICSFCPYCKVIYNEGVCARYLDSLLKEIHTVGAQYPERKKVTSLYFGGGTPALAKDRLGEIIAALKEHFVITEIIGVELHPRDVTPEVLAALRDAGVTAISIGVQSFLPKFASLLGRDTADPERMRDALEM